MRVIAAEREAAPPTATSLEEDRCSGAIGDTSRVVKVDSAKFASVTGREHVEIYSNVEIMPTAALAAKNDAANASQRAVSCAERFLPRAFARQNGRRVHYGQLSITRIPLSLPGGYGISVAATVLGVPAAIEAKQPHLYTDGFAFLSGRAEVALLAVAFPEPAPAGVESRLMSLLYDRAKTHTL